jgi:dihydrofolate reductase
MEAMMRLVVSEFVSLDMVMEDPGGAENYEHGGWNFRYDVRELETVKRDELFASDALLLGRVTYEGFAAAWPTMTDEEGFADRMNSLPKYVVSSTRTQLDWNNSQLVEGDVVDAVTKLKEQPGGDLLVGGSAMLVQHLARHELVDLYRLAIFPLVLGTGKRLFGDVYLPLELVDQQALSGGVNVATYRPALAGEAA